MSDKDRIPFSEPVIVRNWSAIVTNLRIGILAVLLMVGYTRAIESLSEIAVGGVYRMTLTTGDVLEGVVESKNDTSLILESEGKPFTFRKWLVTDYELLAPPKKTMKLSGEDGAVAEVEIIPYDQLIHQRMLGREVDLRITSGTRFRGTIVSVTEDMLKLNVDGSIIPFTRDVIGQVSTVVAVEAPKSAGKQRKSNLPEGPLDTVMVAGGERDASGAPKEPLYVVGAIEERNDKGIRILTRSGEKLSIPAGKVVRVFRHTVSPYERRIKQYAKPLFCPGGMVLVDLPPGDSVRPFFKTCIDKYEYPGKKGDEPKGNVSFEQAKEECAAHGKRLCTVEEWKWACGGLEGYKYPYGWHFEEKNCNTKGYPKVEPSGQRRHCVGKFGLYDMVGNLFEWVVDDQGDPMLMGGPLSKCQTVSPGLTGDAKPHAGFRCCKSN